jgi:DNA-binding XRE family transcriptional regulator
MRDLSQSQTARGIDEPKVLLAISIAAVLGVAVAGLFRRR